MDLQKNEKKNACVIFRSVYEAALELDKDQALELFLTYTKIGLGEDVNLDECSQVVRLILKQNLAYLDAAERRYKAACENGKKGKDAGKKGGRPKKGETKEEAYERRNPSKTPEETPVIPIEKTPVKPLEKEKEKEYEKDKEIEYTKETIITKEDKYKNLSWEEYLKLFINQHPSFNYELESSIFVLTYRDNLEAFQKFLLEKTGQDFSIDFLTYHLRYFATFGRVYQYNEETIPA